MAFGASYTYSTPSFDGWILRLDSLCTVGVREEATSRIQPGSAVVARNGVLSLPGTVPAILVDLAGCRVADLRPGANDIRHLGPGVYFCRPTAGSASSVRKVVILD